MHVVVYSTVLGLRISVVDGTSHTAFLFLLKTLKLSSSSCRSVTSHGSTVFFLHRPISRCQLDSGLFSEALGKNLLPSSYSLCHFNAHASLSLLVVGQGPLLAS